MAFDGGASPCGAATPADPLGARGLERSLDESFGEGGEVRSAIRGRRDGPDVTGVLAERMGRKPASLHLLQPRVVPRQRTRPCRSPFGTYPVLGGRPGNGRPGKCGAGGDSDGVEVEEVVLVSGEQEQRLPGGVEPIPHARGQRVGLGPHHLVAHHPPCFGQGEQQLLWSEDQALCRCTLSWLTGVGVSQVQPHRTVRLEHPLHLSQHGGQVADPAVDRVLQTDLSGHAVVAQQKVRRRGHHGVH